MNIKRKIRRLIGLIYDYYLAIRISFMSKEDKFLYIYKTEYWKGEGNGSLSGGGSNEVSTNIFISELRDFIIESKVTSLVDIPCGDWKWMSKVDLNNVNYIGCDVVPDLIKSNNKIFKKPNVNFLVKDLIKEDLPQSDLILVRDLLVHLDDSDIVKCLCNIKKTNYKYIGITNYPNLEENKKRLLGDYLRFGDKWRAINLTKEPYNLPEPTLNLSDNNDLSNIDKGKYISIWENKNFDLSNININP